MFDTDSDVPYDIEPTATEKPKASTADSAAEAAKKTAEAEKREKRRARQKRHDEQRHDRALAALGALRRAHRRAAALAVIALSAVIAARPRGVIALTLRLALLAAAQSVRIIYRIVIIEAGMVPFLIAHCDTFLSLEI